MQLRHASLKVLLHGPIVRPIVGDERLYKRLFLIIGRRRSPNERANTRSSGEGVFLPEPKINFFPQQSSVAQEP